MEIYIELTTDGAYNMNKNLAGGGIVVRFLRKDRVTPVLWEEYKPELASERSGPVIELYTAKAIDVYGSQSVTGELLAAVSALKYVEKLRESHEIVGVTLRYDNLGIKNWVTGEWRTKKAITIEYRSKVLDFQKHTPIIFVKVVAHTGDEFNEEADNLAKKACEVR